MALIDKDDLLKEWRESYQYSKDHDMPSEAFFFGSCIDQVESIAEEVDPVHYAGGCYCRECESTVETIDYLGTGIFCRLWGRDFMRVHPDDFCKFGRRRGGGE